MARAPQAGTERGSVQSMKGAAVSGGEVAETVVPDEGDHDTLLELLRLKVSRDLPHHRGTGGSPLTLLLLLLLVVVVVVVVLLLSLLLLLLLLL